MTLFTILVNVLEVRVYYGYYMYIFRLNVMRNFFVKTMEKVLPLNATFDSLLREKLSKYKTHTQYAHHWVRISMRFPSRVKFEVQPGER